MDDWVQAAGNIVRPQNQRVIPSSTMGPDYETVHGPSIMSGVSLLAKHDPSVTNLLRLRMEEVEVLPTQKFGEMPPGSALANDLLKWDPLGGAGAIHARRDDKDAKLDHGKSMRFRQREGEYPASLSVRFYKIGYAEILSDPVLLPGSLYSVVQAARIN